MHRLCLAQRKKKLVYSLFCLPADLGLAALELLHLREIVDDHMQLVAPLAGVLQQQLHLQAAAGEGAVAAANRQLNDAAGTSGPSKEANRRCAFLLHMFARVSDSLIIPPCGLAHGRLCISQRPNIPAYRVAF